jgi:2-hydroxychromene-2-carboxylate isomerase
MEAPQRRRYFLADMARSAAFHSVPYREPVKLPVSSHFATRIYYWLADQDGGRARLFGRDVFTAFLVDQQDITDPETLLSLAARRSVSREDAEEAMNGQLGRDRLSNAVDEAVKEGVVGSPFFIVDGEGFFGADRVAQIAWRLASKQLAARGPDRSDFRS